MKSFIRIPLLVFSIFAGATNVQAQANYWNIGGTYFNCNTGAVSTTPTNITDLYADAFAVPGLCNTYYRVGWVNVFGPPHGNALVISDVSADPTGHPFNGSGDQYYLISDGFAHAGASVAVAPAAPDGTRKVYATYDNLIKSWTINADGTVSAATTLYTYSSSNPFDSRTATEVSSDGQYLLINALGSPAGAVIVFNLSTNIPTNYPTPGGFVTGYEYVTGWSASPRIYVSYNTMWVNPSGIGGFGYYDLGNTSTFNNITAGPSGTDIRGFGFTDIEKAKNGKLYLSYNPTLSTSISNAGTLYSYTSTGVWAAVSGISVPATGNNWNYYLQTQIDGENYNNSYYTTPTVLTVKMNSINGGTTAATAPIIYRCPGSGVTLDATYGGVLNSKLMAITLGTISGGVFIPNPPGTSYPYSQLNSINTLSVPLTGINPTVGSYTGAIMVDARVNNPCVSGAPFIRYFNVQNASVLASYTKPGCISLGLPCSKTIQTTLPITTTPPTPASAIATFRANIDAAQGYMGAGYCGMFGINTNGNWTVSVYEVDATTGVRKVRSGITAPTIAYFTGSGPVTGSTYFNQTSYLFNSANPPFYYDVTSAYGDGPYFSAFYDWSRMNGTLTSDFGTRVYAAELVVIEPTSGCTVTNKSYFKIALNGTFANGANAKPSALEPDEEDGQVSIYPNPAKTTLTIVVPQGVSKASVALTDNTGRVLIENQLANGKNTLNIESLSAGVYFYNLSLNGKIQHGKIVKQ
jgi:hypothetical protein